MLIAKGQTLLAYLAQTKFQSIMVTITNWKESVKNDNLYFALFWAEVCGFVCKQIELDEDDMCVIEFNGKMDVYDVQSFLYNLSGGAESEEEYKMKLAELHPILHGDYNWGKYNNTYIFFYM